MASTAPWKATALGLAVTALGVVGTTFAFAEGRDAAVTVAPVGIGQPAVAEPAAGEPTVADPAPSRPLGITPRPAPAPEPVPAPTSGDDDLDDDLGDDLDDTDN